MSEIRVNKNRDSLIGVALLSCLFLVLALLDFVFML